MRKLITASFSRLWKEKVFWVSALSLAVCAVFFSYLNYQTSMRYDSDPIYVEDVLFNLFPMIAFVCAGCISLFLGTEFDENTIRNKLVVGHTRTQIYFANYLTCMVVSLVLLFVILVFSGIAGYIFFRVFMMEWAELAFLILCCVLCTMVYDGVTITMEGVQFGDLVENPAYVEGSTRTVMEFIYDMLPTGQAIQINNMDFDRCLRWPVLSVIMLFVATFAGYMPFRKRDIR